MGLLGRLTAVAALFIARRAANAEKQPDNWWYLKIGRDIKETGLAAGVIEHPLHTVWDKIKDFGDWNFVPGMVTVCDEVDAASGYCLVRNVTQPGIDKAGYHFLEQHYQERQIINKRKDGLLEKVIHYERVVAPEFSSQFSAKMTFKLSIDPSDPFYTIVEQSGKFKKSQRNIMPMASDIASVGFLRVIDELRKSFDNRKFAGEAVISLNHLFQQTTTLNNLFASHVPIGGVLRVKSGDYLFEEVIKDGFSTEVRAGFDQIHNGWITIEILSEKSNNNKYNNDGTGGRTVLCSTSAQVTILPHTIEFNDCNIHVTGRAVLPSLAAIGIFEEQLKTLNLWEVLEMAGEAREELIAFAITAINEQAQSFVEDELSRLNLIGWELDFGNYTYIPSHVEEIAYHYFGLTVSHFSALLKGHVDWFVGNLQPAMMQYKALTEPDPWLNFLIPESARLEEAYQLSKIWGNDDEFCRQFLQGANPLEITKVTKTNYKKIIPTEFNGMYDINNDQLYYVDYSKWLNSIMDELPDGNLLYPNTFALFRVVSEQIAPTSLLEVVGIQLEKHGIVYHKQDGKKWRYLFAKMWVQNAAMQTQEFMWHLGIAHFLPEGIIAPLHNAFAAKPSCDDDMSDMSTCAAENDLKIHPIYRLLKPHFKYTLGMGSLARLILDGRSTKVADVVFAAGHKGVITLIDTWYETYTFNDFTMEKQILDRGITKSDLPKYYYRDDALKLWNILQNYCKEVVNTVYNNDNSLKSDDQLQTFARLTSDNINGFPKKFTTRDQLAFSLANIIATPVILHTATNYAQAPYNYFPVNRPFRLKAKMSDFDGHGDLTPDFINNALPNYIEQFIGLMFMHVLTLPPDNSLLDTASDSEIFKNMDNPPLEKQLQQVQNKFYQSLVGFGNEIARRDNVEKSKNHLPYPYFQPANTCTSTNI